MKTSSACCPIAPAIFIGIQEGIAHIPDTEIFNLTAEVAGRPMHSTVARFTLESAGFFVPPASVREARRANWYRRNRAA